MGGYTRIPNDVLEALPEMSPAAVRLTMALCRLTYGWRKTSTTASVSELSRLTGLSRLSVRTATGQIANFFTHDGREWTIAGGVEAEPETTEQPAEVVTNLPESGNLVTTSLVTNLPGGGNLVTRGVVSNLPVLHLPKESIKKDIKKEYNGRPNGTANGNGHKSHAEKSATEELIAYFLSESGCKSPRPGDVAERWVMPLIAIYKASGEDYTETRRRVTEAIQIMRRKQLTVTTPASIQNVAVNLTRQQNTGVLEIGW